MICRDMKIEVWIESLLSAWQAHDVSVGAEQAAACFSESVMYQDTPFATELEGRDAVREYWLEMLKVQKDVSYSYDIISWQGGRLVLNWWVRYRDVHSNEVSDLNGISIGMFDLSDLCYDWREWWHKQD